MYYFIIFLLILLWFSPSLFSIISIIMVSLFGRSTSRLFRSSWSRFVGACSSRRQRCETAACVFSEIRGRIETLISPQRHATINQTLNGWLAWKTRVSARGLWTWAYQTSSWLMMARPTRFHKSLLSNWFDKSSAWHIKCSKHNNAKYDSHSDLLL